MRTPTNRAGLRAPFNTMRAIALAMLSCFASIVTAQTAVMLDGRILTQKVPLSLFATEGPIWNLDLANQGIVVTGRTVTIPATVNGQPLLIDGSSVLSGDGHGVGIGASNFNALLDSNAIGRDRDLNVVSSGLGPRRLGAVRSIFGTSEARRPASSAGIVREPQAQTLIEQNYLRIVEQCYQAHAAALPADFLDRAGVLGRSHPVNGATTSMTPGHAFRAALRTTARSYPMTTGGTLKSAGHIYVDAEGKEYYVPDIEVVIELAENVATGVIRSVARGDSTRPDSFVIGDMLVVFNQDPRFGADVLGLADAIIPREIFFSQIIPGQSSCDVIGHMVGEHVMFVQEVLTELVDPDAGIQISADRFVIRVGAGEARWRGIIDKPQGVLLFAVLIDTAPDGVQTSREFNIPFVIDPLNGAGTYDARLRGIDVANTTHIEMQARDATTSEVVASHTYDVVEFRQ
jgi:hypothetical protein